MWLPFLIVSPEFFGHLSSGSWITQNSADIRRRTVSWREACCLVFFLLCYNWHWPINVLQLPSDYVVARVRSVACGKKKKHQLSEDMAGYSEKDIDTEEELQWKPPSEAELKVIQARRDRSDRISKIMGSYLLKGYKMLASECSKCGVPMPL